VQPVDLTAQFKLPPEQHHNWKYLRFGPDDARSCRSARPLQHLRVADRVRADPSLLTPMGRTWRVIATGVRNTQGFDWHPVTSDSGSPTTAVTGWATTARKTV
jgi:glucose/arabinose dehydrogenase